MKKDTGMFSSFSGPCDSVVISAHGVGVLVKPTWN